MKRILGHINIYIVFWWFLNKDTIKKIIKQLITVKTIILFCVVVAIVSSEVWVSYIIYFITHNSWWLALGNSCWIFWLGPFTPFIPLCITITLGIKGIYYKIKNRLLK